MRRATRSFAQTVPPVPPPKRHRRTTSRTSVLIRKCEERACLSGVTHQPSTAPNAADLELPVASTFSSPHKKCVIRPIFYRARLGKRSLPMSCGPG